MGKKTRNMSLLEKKCRLHKGSFRTVPVTTHQNGSMELNLPEIDEEKLQGMLPHVSIVTITKDRGVFAGIMLYNWINIKYPRDKLEWIIVDDSVDTTYDLADYIPQDDPSIKYYKLDKWLPVADKRNKAVELANYDYIVHMDDDDYYFPDNVLAKIRIMMHYKCEGVHSLPIGVYDMMEKTSYIFDPCNKQNHDSNNCAEATLAYTKKYWQNNKFYSNNALGTGEGTSFIGKHFDKWIKVHFIFNMISITHSKNITGNSRRFINDSLGTVNVGNFEDMFPVGFKHALDNIRKILIVDYVKPDC